MKECALTLHIMQKYLHAIRLKKKTVEGRLFKPAYQHVKPGDAIRLISDEEELLVSVTKLKRYATFAQMLEVEGLQNCLPGVENHQEGVALYHSFANYKEQEKNLGVLAIGVEVV